MRSKSGWQSSAGARIREIRRVRNPQEAQRGAQPDKKTSGRIWRDTSWQQSEQAQRKL